MVTSVRPDSVVDVEAAITEAEAILEQARASSTDSTTPTAGLAETDTSVTVIDGLKWA